MLRWPAKLLFLAALAGLSQNMLELILFRALQGFGGGGLIVSTIARRRPVASAERRARRFQQREVGQAVSRPHRAQSKEARRDAPRRLHPEDPASARREVIGTEASK